MWKCPTCGTEHKQLQDLTAQEFEALKQTLIKEAKKRPNRANGGKARAAKLSPERRREIASKAATARWSPTRAAALSAAQS